jgi:cellulose synthase/poly-beta-1,6-N-acetylglucosamine synthase-like glycosyltransferase
MEIFITIIYVGSLLYLFLFSLGQLHLTWIYLKKSNTKTSSPPEHPLFEPMVTIQLPVYNEKYVVERLIDAVSTLEYPREKLEIQILDDSTDETTGIIYQTITALKDLALKVNHIHRTNREGFKAGALAHGLQSATGEFIAVFDSDFIPQPDFLRKTLQHFTDPSIGAVQARWGHINQDYSLLTRLQAFGLDAHFSIEQSARNAAGSFINFNGTCGVWRKHCIVDAGGWSDDTLTEDLDLSYRAQLKGWKFIYLEDVVAPGELPVIMPVIKSQQYRWNKGGAETARKIFSAVLRSEVPLRNKVHAFFHLFNSSVFVALLTAALLSIPMLFIKQHTPALQWVFNTGTVLLIGFLSISFFYWTATKRFHPNSGRRFISLFPAFLLVSMGLSLHNGLAVIEGLIGIKTPFIRTPKFNIVTKKDNWKSNSYVKTNFNLILLLEGFLCCYFLFGIVKDIQLNDPLIVFHSMLALGFGSVFFLSLKPLTNA